MAGLREREREILRRIRFLLAEQILPQFTVEDVAQVIRSAISPKVLGPYGISTMMLNHRDKLGVEYFTKVLNLLLATLGRVDRQECQQK